MNSDEIYLLVFLLLVFRPIVGGLNNILDIPGLDSSYCLGNNCCLDKNYFLGKNYCLDDDDYVDDDDWGNNYFLDNNRRC